MSKWPQLYVSKDFTSAELKVGAYFNTAYEHSIRTFGSKIFLRTYQKNGHQKATTFQQFSLDVQKVKNFLLSHHPTKQIIATKAGNTYEHLVYIIAILSAGYTFCPLSPRDLESRTTEKVSQLGDKAALLTDLTIPAQAPSQNLSDKKRTPDQAFIYIFTSGTTGYSKLVHQTELGVMTNVEAVIRHHELTENTVIGTPLPVFHVNALEFSFFGSLFSGAELVLFEDFQAAQIFEALETHQIQIMSIVPHLLKNISDQIHKLTRKNIENFKYFVTAAAPVSGHLLNNVFANHNLKIIQGYGLSEAINFSLTMPIHLNKEQTLKWYTHWDHPSVGVPVFANDISILKDDLSPCNEGQVGEICIRGPHIMKEYKDQDMQPVFRGGYFHTGDQGYFHIDSDTGLSFYFICGRLKDICKRAGVTVSLVEVDNILLKWAPADIDLISFYFDNDYVGEEIAIAINCQDQKVLEALQKYCNENMSSDMRPRYILPTTASLRTESGKPMRWKFKTELTQAKEFISGNSITILSLDTRKN